MAPGRARDEQKERQWRRWIDQWRASGLSVRAFCARHGLATASFYALAARAAAARGRAAARSCRCRSWPTRCRPGQRPGSGPGRWPGGAGRSRL